MSIVSAEMPFGTEVRFWVDRSALSGGSCAYTDVQGKHTRGNNILHGKQ